MNNPHLALIFIRRFSDFFRESLDQLSIFFRRQRGQPRFRKSPARERTSEGYRFMSARRPMATISDTIVRPHLSPLARRFDRDHRALHALHGRHRARAHRLRLDQAYRGELALCEPTHRPRQIHGAAGREATRGRYRAPPPAGTACAVDAIPRQAGSEMQSAEELGQRLRRRYQRQQQRQGIARPGRGRAEGEIAEQLDRLLVQD